MISERELYRVSEVKGEVCLMVRLAKVPAAPYYDADGKPYNIVAVWGIHSKHPDFDTAQRVKNSLLYDMDNPS
ncbi:hypothetical protein LCGC14_1768810 [marine sediment metagenome]|uniref:Uncharacterized protein n=1 Tax=marine sediment metagenome TaxID=412755 RepID=A0A0F9JDU0_9ZZZZ